MIEVLNTDQDNILGIKSSEKMTPEELDKMDPVLEDHIEAYANPRLLMVIEDFKGWSEPKAFWKDFKLDSKSIGEFDQIAFVGDREWENWFVKIFAPIAPGKIKYFDIGDLPRARIWLKD